MARVEVLGCFDPPVTLPGDRHRGRRASHDRFGDASEQYPGHPRAAVAAEDDVVDALALGDLNDRGGRATHLYEVF